MVNTRRAHLSGVRPSVFFVVVAASESGYTDTDVRARALTPRDSNLLHMAWWLPLACRTMTRQLSLRAVLLAALASCSSNGTGGSGGAAGSGGASGNSGMGGHGGGGSGGSQQCSLTAPCQPGASC